VLPSTRELAEQWDTSTFTISEAMRILIEDGLVVSKSRSQRTVNAPSQQEHHQVRPVHPNVVMIGGYAGSGKSELGRILVRETGWPMLDKDSLTRPVVEAALELLGRSPNDRESDLYTTQLRPREYEALATATAENVECGNSAIVTAPFVREFADRAWLAKTQASYAAMNATTTFVWVYCDAASMQTYIRRRGAARDSAKLSDWPGWLGAINLDFRPAVEHVVIDNSESSPLPLSVQAKRLLESILSSRT
ncbi:AAA family ATPase, partial [Luedemannella flava]|uniref:AAA family ATPase n=1 Tax=Luedemannella flava TaxID=349316 RepID=UPI0031DCE387